jgi:hypothetical protein
MHNSGDIDLFEDEILDEILSTDTDGNDFDMFPLEAMDPRTWKGGNNCKPQVLLVSSDYSDNSVSSLGASDSSAANSISPKEAPLSFPFLSVNDTIVHHYDSQEKDSDGKNTLAKKEKKVHGKRRRPSEETTLKSFYPVTDKDVLFGRGRSVYSHIGNMRLHEEKLKVQDMYLGKSRVEKKLISQFLVDLIHELGGRFLKEDKTTGMWYEANNEEAREKSAQVLREDFTSEQRRVKREKYFDQKKMAAYSQSTPFIMSHPVCATKSKASL